MGNLVLLGVLAVVVLGLLYLQRRARRVEPTAPPVAIAIAQPAPLAIVQPLPQPSLVSAPIAEAPKRRKKKPRLVQAVATPTPKPLGIAEVLAMLKNPQTQAAAVVLREVFDAPLCKRH